LNDLTSAKFSLLQAQTQYAQSKLQLDQATSMILDHYNIQLDEAKNGHVTRRPDPIPAVPPNGAFNQRGEPLKTPLTTVGALR
jgi:outer membrane protein TolC